MGLRKQHELGFLEYNDMTKKNLKLIENFIIFGSINRPVIRTLLSKRGFLKNEKELIPIKSNKVVEDILGNEGLVCIEDLVTEIATVGSNFEKIKKYLWYYN